MITHGLAFHPELSPDPQPPYTPEAFPIIQGMIQQRASVLLEAAETNDSGNFLKTIPKIYLKISCFFKKWANTRLFLFIFCLFKQTSLQFLHKIYVKNVHPVYGAGI